MGKKVFKDVVKWSNQNTGAKLLFFNWSEYISCKQFENWGSKFSEGKIYINITISYCIYGDFNIKQNYR